MDETDVLLRRQLVAVYQACLIYLSIYLLLLLAFVSPGVTKRNARMHANNCDEFVIRDEVPHTAAAALRIYKYKMTLIETPPAAAAVAAAAVQAASDKSF